MRTKTTKTINKNKKRGYQTNFLDMWTPGSKIKIKRKEKKNE